MRNGLLLIYGVPAALIGSPWYPKKWLLLGNPLWPLLGYDPNDYNQYISPIVQFEGGLWGRLLSPYHLFTRGSVEDGGVRPPLAPLVVPLMVGDVRNFYLDTPAVVDVAMLEFRRLVNAPDAGRPERTSRVSVCPTSW